MVISEKVDFPVYGACFVDNSRFLVCGGGGEGNNGIPNRMCLKEIEAAGTGLTIKEVCHVELAANEDSPMSIAYKDGTVLCGINENSSKNPNNHLRKFHASEEKVEFISSMNLFQLEDATNYQKYTKISPAAVKEAIVGSSNSPDEFYTVNYETMESIRRLQLEGIRDICYSSCGQYIYAISKRKLTKMNREGKIESVLDVGEKGEMLCKVIDTQYGLIVLSVGKVARFTGLRGFFIDAELMKVKKSACLVRDCKNVTAVDVFENYLTFALSNNSFHLFKCEDFSQIKSIMDLHSFAITDVAIRGEYIVTVSAANTIKILTLEELLSQRVTTQVLVLLVLIIAVLLGFILRD